MRNSFFMTKRALAGAVAAAALLVAGSAQAALQDRDLDGDLVTDAFYDTDLDITWLRNANVNGWKDWATAVSWADNFTLGGYTDWRLPTSDNTCLDYNCTGSEMGHLWYVELGNTSNPVSVNTGGFQNVEPAYYWSGTAYTGNACCALVSNFEDGRQSFDFLGIAHLALAVRPGDVPAVPEPETYALMLAGLAALAMARRRQRT